jgi:hypothetical protein
LNSLEGVPSSQPFIILTLGELFDCDRENIHTWAHSNHDECRGFDYSNNVNKQEKERIFTAAQNSAFLPKQNGFVEFS